MTCNFTEKISSLIDGELPQAEAREVERHLLNCGECEQLRADFLNLRTQISSYRSALEPKVQNRALKEILAERRAPVVGLRWAFGAQALAFAMLLITGAIIGLIAYQNSKTTEQESQQSAAVHDPTPAPAATATPAEPEEQKSPEPARENESTPNKESKETPRRAPANPNKRLPAREPKPGEQFAAIPDRVRAADAETLTALHFEKSETMLRFFRNVRLNQPESAAQVRYERSRAKQLVFQNMMLRREAVASGDVQISSLLESLEPILLDIANLPDKPDPDSVRVIRERVERKNIVPLLRVNSTALARALD